MSNVRDKLIEKLTAIWDDDEFVLGIISNASHDDDRQTIIEYIDKGEDVTVEQLILLSVYLDQEREKQSN